MNTLFQQSLSGVPAFLAYFFLACALLLGFVGAYTLLTPQREFTLIKRNVSAAAVALGGSVLGFVLPLASAIAHSVSFLDCLVWGLVAMLVQVLTFLVLRLLMPQLPRAIEADHMAPALFVAFASIAVGVLNAASMTY